MYKLYKMSAFTLLIMSLVIMFGGIFFSINYMQVPDDTIVSADLAMGRLFFVNRCFEIANMILVFANIALSYAILTGLKLDEKDVK
ncbi:MAG: hypothetical protein PHW04_08255 [Candidatus Wallbacteria bacterium]|nr:hypothetical protein [Candidatus Wallbacteria bacterium]